MTLGRHDRPVFMSPLNGLLERMCLLGQRERPCELAVPDVLRQRSFADSSPRLEQRGEHIQLTLLGGSVENARMHHVPAYMWLVIYIVRHSDVGLQC